MSCEQTLRSTGQLSKQAIRAAIADLGIRDGARGLDAGCGIGTDSMELVHAVGATGQVVGVDIARELLDAARGAAEANGISSRLEFRTGDLCRLPFDAHSFDFVWCRDVLWGHLLDPVAGVGELARTVRLRGFVALAFWCSQCLLPGHPELEARLMQAWTERAPYTAAIPPGRHYLRALGWMLAAGLVPDRPRSYSCTVSAPLDTRSRLAMADAYWMFFGGLERHVTGRDWEKTLSLVRSDSPDFLPNRDDFCATLTYVVFKGIR
ncbi:MAG: methyltransferase domain-containing protein [Polyangiaceae bacterium]|nr:methyltransferase domain-containing protein [Polyangiaceae bacterium]